MVRSRALGVAVAVVLLLAGGWYGDAGSAIPINGFGEPGLETMLQPPSVALRLVQRELLLYGGVPHDARMTQFSPYLLHAMIGDDPRRIVSATGYIFKFVPSDTIDSRDEIIAKVGTETVRTCLDGGTLASPYERKTEPSCHHYRITMPLRVASVQRQWRAWPVRAVTRRLDAWFAPQFQAPESIEEGCSNRDVGAFRRAVAAATLPFAPKGNVDITALWERAVQSAMDGHGVLARWEPPYPSVRFAAVWTAYHTFREVEISEAIVLDVPVFPGWPSRLVLVRSPRPIDRLLVGVLETTNDEPVCPPVRIAEATPPPAALPDWDTMQRIVQARAEDEIRWLAAFRGMTLGSRVVAADHHPGATSTIDVEAWIDRAHWRGRFTVDERVPEIRDAEFVRM